MTTHEVLLEAREEIAEGTMAFHFQKPAGFSFKPGQTIDLVLANLPSVDAASARHTFSLVSAPFQDVVTIATRMRDSVFKSALKVLPIGAAAKFEGPFGSLTLHTSRARPAVFIVGGIGITPFMSIVRQATQDHLPQHLVLLYSNRRPEEAAFLAELHELERTNRNFRLLATMTAMNGSGRSWPGMSGRIDRDLIKMVGREGSSPVYYVTGSPSMVAGLQQLLNDADVNEDDIRSEEFFGY